MQPDATWRRRSTPPGRLESRSNASPSAPAWMRWRCETSWPLLRPQRCTLVLAAHGRHAAEVPVYAVVGVEGAEPSRPQGHRDLNPALLPIPPHSLALHTRPR